MDNSIRDFVQGIPPVTRFLFLGTLAVTFLGNFNVLGAPMSLIMDSHFYEQLQLWRLVTAMLFAGGLSFHFLMNLYMLYTYSRKLEEGQRFFGRTADYIMMVAMATVCHGIIALVRGSYIYNAEMMLTILYVWSQLNAEQIVTFYFGTRFKAMYLPYAMGAFQMLSGGSLAPALTGIAVGHLYYLLDQALPATNGVRYLDPPAFLLNYFPYTQATFGSFQTQGATVQPSVAAGNRPAAPSTGSYPWRGGHRLGTQ